MPRTARGWPPPGSGRPASCSSGGRWSRSGAPTTGANGTGSSAALPRRNPAGPVRLGVAAVGAPGPCAPPGRQRGAEKAWQNFLRAAVARYGPGGSYWATVPAGIRTGRHAAADPVLAGLERAQSEEVLHPGNTTGTAAQKYAQLLRSPTTRSRPGSAGPDRPRRNARLRGRDGLGLPQPLYGWPGSRRLRRRRPAPLRRNLDQVPPADLQVQRRDEEPRRRGRRRCG